MSDYINFCEFIEYAMFIALIQGILGEVIFLASPACIAHVY